MKKKLKLTTQERDVLEYLLIRIKSAMKKNYYDNDYCSVGQFFCSLTPEEEKCLENIIDKLRFHL
jgi:hypothetical protein